MLCHTFNPVIKVLKQRLFTLNPALTTPGLMSRGVICEININTGVSGGIAEIGLSLARMRS
jgi:hypothetical protein